MNDSSERILVLAATQKDSESTCQILAQSGFECFKCQSPEEFFNELKEGAGAVIIAKEVLNPNSIMQFSKIIDLQPTWSFLPIIILIGSGDLALGNPTALNFLKPLRNTTLLERPVRIGTLTSVIQSSLADRRRQYEVSKLLSALEISKQEALDATKTKSMFLANMSHEIRSPLGAIMGFSDLLKAPDISEKETSEYISVIDRNSRQLLRIIDNILDLTKVEAGKLQIEHVEFSLKELLSDFKSIMEFRAKDKGILFEIKFKGLIPEFVTSDPTRLRQILTNIVGNAIKFTEHGHVGLELEIKNQDLLFTVTDTGIGISVEQAENLFQPFQQADLTTTRKFGGTGLGLVLTRKLCEALNGTFVLEKSTPNAGSVFTATIRADSFRNSKILDSNSLTVDITGDSKPETANLKILEGMKILIVDDSSDNQVLFNLILTHAGAKTKIASDGNEGVKLAMDDKFDVILMDVQMPHMDGHEATKTLRQQGHNEPIIALTAHAMNEEKERAKQSGFTGFLAKPVRRSNLIEMLTQLKKTHENRHN
jgi:signal transduction histidine kinase/ActR/RegA family two-component response regulator